MQNLTLLELEPRKSSMNFETKPSERGLITTEVGEDYAAMNVLARRGAGDGGNEQTCRSNKTPYDDSEEDEDRPTFHYVRKRERERGRGLHKLDTKTNRRAGDTITKGLHAAKGEELQRMKGE